MGILQARILEWVTFPFSRGSSHPRIKPRSPAFQEDSLPAEPSGKPKNTGVSNLSLLEGIFLTQESNQGLLHCRRLFTSWATREANFLFEKFGLLSTCATDHLYQDVELIHQPRMYPFVPFQLAVNPLWWTLRQPLSDFCHHRWALPLLQLRLNGLFQDMLFVCMTLSPNVFEMLSCNCTYPWFVLLSSIPLYEYTTSCLSLFLLMYIYLFIFLVIVNKSCMCLSVDMLSFLWGKYLEMELLAHRRDDCWTFKELPKRSLTWLDRFILC